MIEFQKYPKTPRLFRDVVITEKIDGTNSGVQIVGAGDLLPVDYAYATPHGAAGWIREKFPQFAHVEVQGVYYVLAAQSRNRMITPGDDNHGFAGWAYDNAEMLVRTLGPGVHFGEWWGQGIQRRYGLDYKKFSLFNVARWGHLETESPSKHLGVVPTLYEGLFNEGQIRGHLEMLKGFGSSAAPGFMNPEGVIVFHKASGKTFKYTIENDEEPKGAHR